MKRQILCLAFVLAASASISARELIPLSVNKEDSIVRHIYHEAPSMDSKSRNYDIQRDTIARCSTWCQNGISKYLQ